MDAMKEYCEKNKWDFDKAKFSFDGELLSGKETPSKLEMEEGDILDAVLN